MAVKTISAKKCAKRYRIGLAGLVAAPILLSSGNILAQDNGQGGLSASLKIGQRLESINRTGVTTTNDEGTRSLTTLSFGLQSVTRTQALSFNLSGALEKFLSKSDSFEFEDPRASLRYTLENKNTALSINGSYSRADIEDSSFDENPLTPELDTGTGDRETYSVSTNLTFGRDTRVTTSLGHSFARTKYSGTNNPNLNDSTRHSLSGRMTFELSSEASVNAFANWSKVDEDGPGANDTTTRRAGVGANYAITETTRVNGELSYSINDSTNSNRTEGIGYALGISHDRPNGAVSAQFSENKAITGTRRELSFTRSLETARSALSLSLGVSKTDGFDIQPLVNLTWNYSIDQASSVRVTLSQKATANNNDNELVRSRLSVDYNRELTSLQSISAGLQLIDENFLGTGADVDERSLRVNLNHTYSLGDDWGLVSGYEFSSTRVNGQPDRDRSRIFVGLEKTFAFRP